MTGSRRSALLLGGSCWARGAGALREVTSRRLKAALSQRTRHSLEGLPELLGHGAEFTPRSLPCSVRSRH